MRLLMIILVASAMIGLDPARYSDIHHNGDAIEQPSTTNNSYFYPSSPTLKHAFVHFRLTADHLPKFPSHCASTQRYHNRPPWPKTTMEELGSTLWIAPNWVHVY